MALRAEYTLGHSELNDFLFDFVGEEKSGDELTVLSALARLGLDPWAEGVRLSELTKEAAVNAMADSIRSLPEGNWTASDIPSIAVRLIDRLPKHIASPAKSSPDTIVRDKKPMSEVQKWLIWIGIALAVFMSVSRLFGD